VAIIYGIPDSKKQLEKSLRKSILVASGAKGELAVLDKISELDDNYHILCNVNVNLGHLITDPISKRKDLKKAQMDFVIISKRGVMVIEVKNWSEEYILKNKINIEKYGGKTPHAQTHRNGLVLWIELNPSNRQKKNFSN